MSWLRLRSRAVDRRRQRPSPPLDRTIQYRWYQLGVHPPNEGFIRQAISPKQDTPDRSYLNTAMAINK